MKAFVILLTVSLMFCACKKEDPNSISRPRNTPPTSNPGTYNYYGNIRLIAGWDSPQTNDSCYKMVFGIANNATEAAKEDFIMYTTVSPFDTILMPQLGHGVYNWVAKTTSKCSSNTDSVEKYQTGTVKVTGGSISPFIVVVK